MIATGHKNLISHERSNVAGLPSRRSAHIQDALPRARPEHVSHNHRREVLRNMDSLQYGQ